MPRFFIEKGSDDYIEITGDDAFHISKSLRMKIGDEITVCDFTNTEFDCLIQSISDTAVLLRVVSKHASECEADIKVTVFQALPKGDKFETVVQKAVELGASEIVPVLTERCVSRPDAKSLAKKCERWQKISAEAAKQSGRAIIPDVSEGMDFNSALEYMEKHDLSFFCYEKETQLSLRAFLEANKQGFDGKISSVAFLVGSEGGISDDEAAKLVAHNIPSVSLGKRILRTETAPLAVLSALMFFTGNLE